MELWVDGNLLYRSRSGPKMVIIIQIPRDVCGHCRPAIDTGHRRPSGSLRTQAQEHDDVIKWKHFPRYWPLVRGIHRSPVNSPHKGQWRSVLMFTLICSWINGWVNNREAGDLKRHRANYDVTVMNTMLYYSPYLFLNFNGCTVEVREWISNFFPRFIMITFLCWD